MINKVHQMYKNDRVTRDILEAVSKYITELAENINEIARQRLLNYSTWYLDVIEGELGITEKEDTFEKRCDTVRMKLLTRGKVCVEGVMAICDNYVSYSKIIYSAGRYTLDVILSNEVTEDNRKKLERELRAYIPAHILINYYDYGRTHQELGVFTHQKLEEFTHSELREKGILV